MKNTLESWYSLNQLTAEQYYQLIDLINPSEEYTLAELTLLAQLPSTENLPHPNPNELTRFQRQRDLWDYEANLNYWLDSKPAALSIPYWLKNTLLTILFLLIITLLIK